MDTPKIPKSFGRCGLKIKCLKCKWQVSSICRLKKTRLSSCDHKDKHRFNIVIHIPKTKTSRFTKILDTKDFDTALKILAEFKAEIKRNGYQKIVPVRINTSLVSLVAEYLDALSGINTPEHLVRIRSKEHVRESKTVIQRFCISLKQNGYNLTHFRVADIGDKEVAIFHKYIKNELKLAQLSYNKHFVIMRTFINWLVKVKKLKLENYFTSVKLTFDKKEKTVITESEFEKLIKCITMENGWGFHSGERRSYYKPWLATAFRLALETGTRAEELVNLNWKNLFEVEKGVWVLKIQNLKVNRIQTGKDEGKNIRYIPVTKSLRNLLIELGWKTKIGTANYILEREPSLTSKYVMTFISRSFGHYIKFATDRKIELKDLRKTYVTKLFMILGDKAQLFTGHSGIEVMKSHYISSAYLAGKLNNLDILKTAS